jgi:hypothetical protein|tara:strand:+ start:2423 stop:2689 length:267 start_codon:yes stop_codon:yes gene_type:complete
MKTLYKIKNWIRGFFLNPFGLLPEHQGAFGWSPKEFKKAKRWAKNQPHPKFPDHPSYSLWDYVNNNWIDSEYKLNEINKIKTKKKKSI